MTRMSRHSPALTLAALLAAPQPLLAHGAEAHLGEVDFPTSCTEAADAAFTTGLKHLHHMMYAQSALAFKEAAATDPECAMAQWGIAMASFHPLWPGGPTPDETATGRAAAARLLEMGHGTPREAAFIGAALAFYRGEDVPYPTRLANWATAQRAVLEAFPDDPEAQAFASLAQMTVAPPGPDAVPELIAAGERTDALRAKAPHHPGAFHYSIHAYDHPALRERGLAVARAYAEAAPDVPHALHMPSHIFTRLGQWEESAALNERSATAAIRHSVGDVISNHYPHAVDYAVYAYLQLGKVDAAATLLAGMDATENLEDTFGSAYAAAAAPARMALEQDDWPAAAALPTELHGAITWDRYPQAVAIRHFAIGLGAARSGDTATAQKALAELGTLGAVMQERGLGYWLVLLDAQTKAIEAWLAHASGDDEAAIALMRAAAEAEDRVGKAPVTPGHVLPARELLGDLLLATGDKAGAAEAYAKELEISPNRGRSLRGLAVAQAQ